jgi:predicted DNA binding CopG/RHH family protein
MPTKSTKAPASASTRRKLKDGEEAYVDWLHSPEGQKAEAAARRKRAQRPVVAVDTPLTAVEMREVMQKTGANLRLAKGFTDQPNDPAVIQAIIDRAAEKQTRPISIRISLEDLNAAKRLAGESGIRYQRILKDLIHDGLHSRQRAIPAPPRTKRKRAPTPKDPRRR